MHRLAFALPLVLLSACTEPADPAEVLPEFADVLARDIYDGVWDAVTAEGIDLWQLEDGATHSGELTLASPTVDGDISVTWALSYELDAEFDELDRWTWDFEIEIDSLALSVDELSGSGSWSVEHERYDYSKQDHSFVGQLSVNGEELQDVDFEAYFNGNLHWVSGTMGGVSVEWENPSPDEC